MLICINYSLTPSTVAYFRVIENIAIKPINITIKGNRTKNQDTLVYPAEQR